MSSNRAEHTQPTGCRRADSGAHAPAAQKRVDPDILSALQDATGYTFADPMLAVHALTHASAKAITPVASQRMEFLGDSVVGLCVSDYLYRQYPTWNEGQLTMMKSRVVSTGALAGIARAIGLRRFMILGKGLHSLKRLPDSIYADVFESLTGAIFLDGGIEAARTFIMSWIEPLIHSNDENGGDTNYKSRLQHITQKTFRQIPAYTVVNTSGPDHNILFEVAVTFDGREYARGKGPSKKNAEQDAARLALNRLESKNKGDSDASVPPPADVASFSPDTQLALENPHPIRYNVSSSNQNAPARPRAGSRTEDTAIAEIRRASDSKQTDGNTGTFHAGIDEAGYGPRLGPLCSAVAWVRCAPDADIDAAGVAELAQSVLMQEYDLLIADSKTIYRHAEDLPKLWLPAAIIAGAFIDPPSPPKDTDTLLRKICVPSDLSEMAGHPWYVAGDDFYIQGVGEGLKINAVSENLHREMTAHGVLDFGLRVRTVSAAAFNRRIAVLGNKAELNWELTADHFQFSADAASDGEAISLFCDRQGGRRYYAEKITDAFGEFVWAEIEETALSRYRLLQNDRPVTIEFRVNGESHHPLTALAGMTAKLVREIWMKRFNRFFRLHALPEELKPTSGYHNDSGRFLKQVDRIIRSNKFRMDDLVRTV